MDFSGMLCYLEQHYLGYPGHLATELLPWVWLSSNLPSSSLALWKIRGEKTVHNADSKKIKGRKSQLTMLRVFLCRSLFFLIFAVFSLLNLTSWITLTHLPVTNREPLQCCGELFWRYKSLDLKTLSGVSMLCATFSLCQILYLAHGKERLTFKDPLCTSSKCLNSLLVD